MKCNNITSYFYLVVNLYFSWAQYVLAAMAVPSWFHFMGTAQAYCGACALLVPFRGHKQHISIKKQCPDHIFPDPDTVLYNLLNFPTPQ